VLKTSIGALAPPILLLLDFGFRPALPTQDEPVLDELGVDVLFGKFGQLGLRDESLLGLININGRQHASKETLSTVVTSALLLLTPMVVMSRAWGRHLRAS
jgi:hypothetical protein